MEEKEPSLFPVYFLNCLKLRDGLAELMTPSQIEFAQELARECVSREYKAC